MAKALGTLEWDVVVCGSESTDARMSVLPAMLAERLGAAQLTYARKVEVEGSTVRIERLTESGYDVVEAQLPVVVSVVEKINEPRYPSFKGIMAAKKKPLTELSVSDIGVEPAEVGLAAAASVVDDAEPRPPKAKGEVVKDEGDGGAKIAEFLATNKFI
jgi:electron transfer flavoprotein beta subunit